MNDLTLAQQLADDPATPSTFAVEARDALEVCHRAGELLTAAQNALRAAANAADHATRTAHHEVLASLRGKKPATSVVPIADDVRHLDARLTAARAEQHLADRAHKLATAEVRALFAHHAGELRSWVAQWRAAHPWPAPPPTHLAALWQRIAGPVEVPVAVWPDPDHRPTHSTVKLALDLGPNVPVELAERHQYAWDAIAAGEIRTRARTVVVLAEWETRRRLTAPPPPTPSRRPAHVAVAR